MDTRGEKNEERAIVTCATTKGTFVMEFIRYWSPHGYDRSVGLFEKGFYDHSHFFRTIPDFLVQFGISYNKEIQFQKTIPDDPQLDPPIPFDIGTISYAGSGPNSRDAQMFIALHPGEPFGLELWETPVGRVIEGLDTVVKQFYSYGDDGTLPDQQEIYSGPEYIEEEFPLTDAFKECKVERLSAKKMQQQLQKEQQHEHVVNTEQKKQQQHEHIETQVKHAAAEGGVLVDNNGSSTTPINPTVALLGGAGLLLLFLIVVFKIAPSKKVDKRN